MRRMKGLAAVLALSIILTGCSFAAMPDGSFTVLDERLENWLAEEYDYNGGMMTDEMTLDMKLRQDLDGHLYEKYYLEDDYQFLAITDLFNYKGALIWEGGRYVFCWKDLDGYHEMVSYDGRGFVTEDDEEFWTEESPDKEHYKNWEYRHGIIEAPKDVDPNFVKDVTGGTYMEKFIPLAD